jgi:hypothetical protein
VDVDAATAGAHVSDDASASLGVVTSHTTAPARFEPTIA